MAFLRTIIGVLLIVALEPGTLLATDRFYTDKTVFSADGKLRLEVKSPDNANSFRRPFAKGFVYSLFEVGQREPIWSRTQPQNEGSPTRVFLHNDRHVVVSTDSSGLLLLSPMGQIKLTVRILGDVVLPAEEKEYVLASTAGPIWSGYSHWYFFTAGNEPYFGIRTWWDRRIILSIGEAKMVPDEGAVSKAAGEAERDSVLARLRRGAEVARKWAVKNLPEYSHQDKGPWDEVEGLSSAIHMAGRMGIEAAIPFLLEIEKIPNFGTSSTSFEDDVPAGELLLATHSRDDTRRNVKLSLRRLGARPAGLPAIEVRSAVKGDIWGKTYIPKKHAAPRDERVNSVSKGMKAKAVVDTLGEPDYINRLPTADGQWHYAWEFDVDADKPFTFRVLFSENGSVSSAVKIDPPIWKDKKMRDMQY
jgi:hypothetical protein